MTEFPAVPICIASYSTATSGPRTSPITREEFPSRSAARKATSGAISTLDLMIADCEFMPCTFQPSCCRSPIGISRVSSIVSIRYFCGISRSMAQSSEVFPAPTSPATSTDDCPSIIKLNRPAASGVIDPVFINLGSVHGVRACLRNAYASPLALSGSPITETRTP